MSKQSDVSKITQDGINLINTDLAGQKTILGVTSTATILTSAALTGTPTAPTATAGTNTTQVATTEFVTTAVSAVGSSSGGEAFSAF